MALLEESCTSTPNVPPSFFQLPTQAVLPVGLVRLLGIHSADRGLHRQRLRKVERLAGNDVHRAGDAAFDERRLRALVNDDLAHQLRRQQRVADALHRPAAPGSARTSRRAATP